MAKAATRPNAARIVLATDADTILLFADTLRMHELRRHGLLTRETAGARCTLADGASIVLDSTTAGGTYLLADGRHLWLDSSQTYPRASAAGMIPPTLAVSFAIHSAKRVVAIVAPGRSAASPAALCDSLCGLHGTATAKDPITVDCSVPTLIEYPRDWYRSAILELTSHCEQVLLVTWLALDESQAAGAPKLETAYGTLRCAPAIRIGAERPEPVTWADVRATAAIIGSVTIDPMTRRVEGVPGGADAR